MKVCLLTPTFPLGGNTVRGGTNTYAEACANGLARQGVEVHVVVYDMAQPAPLPTLPFPIHFVSLPWVPYFSTIFPGLTQAWVLAKEVARLDQAVGGFDAIEGSNYEGWMYFAARRFGARFWLRCHTSLGHCIQQRGQKLTWRRRFAVWLDGAATRRAKNLVTHSRCHAQEMGHEYGIDPARVHLVPLGLDFQGAPLFLPAGQLPRTIAYVGILDKRKAIDVLLNAIPGILAKVPSAQFELIGYDGGDSPTGSWQEWFARTYPAALATGQVKFHGFVADDKMRDLWTQLDIVAVPSRYESFGLVVVESYARGKAVITTTGGALPEVAQDGARLVAPGDSAALAAGLIELLTIPGQAAALGQRGHEIYHTSYTLAIFGRNVQQLYAS